MKSFYVVRCVDTYLSYTPTKSIFLCFKHLYLSVTKKNQYENFIDVFSVNSYTIHNDSYTIKFKLNNMKIIISNNAKVSNKHLRFIKWKIRKLNRKLGVLHYLEAHISKEGSRNPLYKSVIRLGVSGHDIILKNHSVNLKELWREVFIDVKRQLVRFKEKRALLVS